MHSVLFQKSKASSEAQGNFLTVTAYKTKKEIIYFQHTVAQNIYISVPKWNTNGGGGHAVRKVK